jgi:hypothetical protein
LDHGSWLRNIPPSQIRDFAYDLEHHIGSSDSPEACALIQAFRGELKKNEISIPTVVALAKAFAKQESFGPARKCYSLLLTLAQCEGADKRPVVTWRKEISRLAPKEFAQYLNKFEERRAKDEARAALEALFEANNARCLDPALAKELAFSEISRRVDMLKLQPACQEYDFYPMEALGLSRFEETSQELNEWRDAKRKVAIDLSQARLSACDEALAEGQSGKALEFLRRAVNLSSLDAETIKLANWRAIKDRWTQISNQPDARTSMYFKKLRSQLWERVANYTQVLPNVDAKTPSL